MRDTLKVIAGIVAGVVGTTSFSAATDGPVADLKNAAEAFYQANGVYPQINAYEAPGGNHGYQIVYKSGKDEVYEAVGVEAVERTYVKTDFYKDVVATSTPK